ncbi:L-aspartate 1-decarboxylase [Thermaerobacter marianensis DSM 12885]|uniref:Aspartate 1-decarboxylase n=2 Tax=Thermaerobacter marianensis TaxID=73919 RepID=E6SIG8_THEM7|nr:aspartate 1-decarboxylase [Thermaerobacter marianensis]ADU50874.1 L-aspartate 1-decarboxylase [Thermaerobacter marianensis DSM 12885]
MLRTFMRAKLHRGTITEANLHYVGSLTVDRDLLAAADILPGELVQVINVTTGARFETYVIPGPAGSGVLGANGGAARLVHPGDQVIVIAYAQLAPDEIPGFRGRVVILGEGNRILEVREQPAVL